MHVARTPPDPEAERALLARFLDPATAQQAAPALLDALRPRLWDHLGRHWQAGRHEFDDLVQEVVEAMRPTCCRRCSPRSAARAPRSPRRSG